MPLQTGMAILGDFLHTGAQTAGTYWRPTTTQGNSELDTNEVAEVVYVEITTPVAGTTKEALSSIYLVLDETSTLEVVNFLGTEGPCMAPKQQLYWDWDNLRHPGVPYIGQLGVPLIQAVKPMYQGQSLLTMATCPKYTRRLRIETVAGTAGITANYRVRLWGYKYDVKDLARLVGPIGGSEPVVDTLLGKSMMISKPVLPVTADTWSQLPGGTNQATPKIHPFVRYATNSVATTASTPYIFRYDTANVYNRENNLYFAYDQEKKAAIVTHLGIRPHANLQNVWVEIGGTRYPKGLTANRPGYEITPTDNPLFFGRVDDYINMVANTTGPVYVQNPFYYPIPRLKKPFLISEEKGFFAMLDTGAPIPQDGVTIAIRGIHVELA